MFTNSNVEIALQIVIQLETQQHQTDWHFLAQPFDLAFFSTDILQHDCFFEVFSMFFLQHDFELVSQANDVIGHIKHPITNKSISIFLFKIIIPINIS
ncbi:hypothetical protein B0A77_00870 [Flavobacterium branchiophilum]|uniref:Uncharacterized protein n=1 Tax=Flavobacterium branchiophilum TaxID=55197 RepID=A0A2H3KEM7_9FLAO|nr:hypothetical protein B0A77_00870 [Flavobacterium branchiophilum]